MARSFINTFVLIVLSLLSVFIISCKEQDTEPESEPLELTFTPTHVSVYEGSDGSIDLTVDGGAAPYNYQWSNGATTEDISNLTAGIYSVIVTDSDHNTVTDSTAITQPGAPGIVSDIDGNEYKIVKIGTQWWMAENLRVTHNPAGDTIISYYPNNKAYNVEPYGRLYSFNTVMNGSTEAGTQGIAPDGWHIPTLEEWNTMIDFLGGEDSAALKLKEQGTEHWTSNPGATNSSGFTAIPAGGYHNGHYDGFGFAAHFWTSSSEGINAYLPSIMDNLSYTLFLEKAITASVRCIKD